MSRASVRRARAGLRMGLVSTFLLAAGCGALFGSPDEALPERGEGGAPAAADGGVLDGRLPDIDASSDAAVDADAGDADDGSPVRRVFVSTSAVSIAAPFDTICANEAAAAGLRPAVAWITYAANNTAIMKLADGREWHVVAGGGGIGALAFPSRGQIAAGAAPTAPIANDAVGNAIVDDAGVWTGTTRYGDWSVSIANCAVWTDTGGVATIGHIGATTELWTREVDNASCAVTRHLICFEK